MNGFPSLPSQEPRVEEFVRKNGFMPIAHRNIPGGEVFVAERYFPIGLPIGNEITLGKPFFRIMWAIWARSKNTGVAAIRGSHVDVKRRENRLTHGVTDNLNGKPP